MSPLFRRRVCLSACLVSSLLMSIEQDREKSWNGKRPPNTIHFSQNTHLSIYIIFFKAEFPPTSPYRLRIYDERQLHSHFYGTGTGTKPAYSYLSTDPRAPLPSLVVSCLFYLATLELNFRAGIISQETDFFNKKTLSTSLLERNFGCS
jgi:hypothetical protein